MGNPWGPLVGSLGRLAACAVVAAVFGYFVFYARVQMWIAPILTLVFTLLLETFLGQTAGYQWRVGTVQLGGYNGMTGIPSFQLGDLVFFGYPFYYYVCCWSCSCFLGCRMLVSSQHGKVMLAIREDPLRTELLGYDIRARQLVDFRPGRRSRRDLGPALRPVGQLHHARRRSGLLQASLPVIWVAVGGRDSLVAVALSTYALNWLNYSLSSAGNQYAMVIIGVLLVAGDDVLPARHHRHAGARAAAPRLARRLARPGGALTMTAGSVLRHRRHWPSGSAASSRPTMSRSTCPRASCAASSARTAPASRPCSRCSAASTARIAGRILLDGRDVDARCPPFRRVRLGLGLTFQTNRAFHALTVRQNLEAAAPGRGVRAEPLRSSATRYAHRPVRPRPRQRRAGARAAAPPAAMARDRHGAGRRARRSCCSTSRPPACRPTRRCRPRACSSISTGRA